MSLKSLIVRIRGDNKNLKSSMKDSEKSVGKFGKTVKKLGGLIAGAFAVRAIANFVKEIFKLAAAAEGVREAFYRIGTTSSLKELKKATSGTVSDLRLMQKAVEASNFQIPLQNLAGLFEFASKRAQQTGQSVDFLVNSIVIGIGRKSPLILDNLGISAVSLREELNQLGHSGSTVGDVAEAVGRIARKEMEKSGRMIETTQVKVEKLAASWENLKIKAGEYFTQSTSLQKDITEWGIFFDLLGDGTKTTGEKLKIFWKRDYIKYAEEAEKTAQGLKGSALTSLFEGDFDEGFTEFLKRNREEMFMSKKPTAEMVQTLASLREALSLVQEQLEGIDIKDTKRIKNTYAEIAAIEKQIAAIEKLGVVRSEGGPGRTMEGKGLPTLGGIDPNLGASLEPMSQAATGVWDLVKAIRALGDEASPALVRFADTVDEWQYTMNDMKMAAVDLATSLTETLFEALGAKNYDDLGRDMLMGFADFLGKLGKLMVAYGLVASGFWEAMANPNPATAAAAIVLGGLAIAAAAAIKGALKGASKATSGGSNASHSTASSSTQSQTVQVYGRLRGSDIVIVSDRSNSNNSTIT